MGLGAVQFAEQSEPTFALDVFGCRCHSKGFAPCLPWSIAPSAWRDQDLEAADLSLDRDVERRGQSQHDGDMESAAFMDEGAASRPHLTQGERCGAH
jgi:hypothetical protein